MHPLRSTRVSGLIFLLSEIFYSQCVNEAFILQLLDDLIDSLLEFLVAFGQNDVDRSGGEHTVIDDLQSAELADKRLSRNVIRHHHINATVFQVALAWVTSQPRVITIPMSFNPIHIRENFEAADIELSPAEMEALNQVGK